jgi:hypothetical protein
MNWTIVAWVVAVIVYMVGIYEGRGQGYKKRKAEELLEKKENPAPVIKPDPPAIVTVDDPGLMRIKSENGFLTLDLDGTRVNTSALSGDQRKRLIEMLTLIRPWLEGKPAAAPAAPPPQAMPAAPQKPMQPIAQPAAAKPIAAANTAIIAKEDRTSAPATSIVGQIDSVLQEQLAGTALEERGIFLSQSPDGGVMVYVGLTKYMAIDDVPDADIKAAIRAAITAWENKYTPGLNK